MEAKNHQRIPALDTLRSAAILWVMLHHLFDWCVPRNANSILVNFLSAGKFGVDLFFVLSGYLIARIALSELTRTGTLNLRSFWSRRWMRTLPAYYAVLAAIYLGDFVIPPDHPWPTFWPYLVFLQTYLFPFHKLRFAWSWSLCVEEWFYMMFPVLILSMNRFLRRPEYILRGIAVTAFGVSVVSRALVPTSSELDYWLVYTRPHFRLDGIAVGVFLATLPRPKPDQRTVALALSALLFLVVFVWTDCRKIFGFQKFAVIAVVFGMLVYASLSGGRWSKARIPGAAFVAEISYALFLLHPIVIKAVTRLFSTSGVPIQVAIVAALTLAASVVLRYTVELPFLALRDRELPQRLSPPTEVAP